METTASGRLSIVQPVYWLVEVAAVLARHSPDSAVEDVLMLQALDLPTDDNPTVLRRACSLAVDLRHHLFDTLYHAIALEEGATLVTADERYFQAGGKLGGIIRLTDWVPTDVR